MKKIILGALLSVSVAAAADNSLWYKFTHPDPAARTQVWWFHGETETTEAGIDADLEAFKAQGVGGVVFYDQVHGKAEGAFPSLSPEWWRMLKHAALKAKQLGLSFGVAVSNGYNAGGPWIDPAHGMQEVTFVDTLITVDRRQEVTLRLATDRKWFRDIATLAFPDDASLQDICILRQRLTVKDNQPLTVSFDAGRAIPVRSISYVTNPKGKGSANAMNVPGQPQKRFFGAGYVDLPALGELEYSTDGINWQTAAALPAIENAIGHKTRQRSVSFPEVMGRWFRIRLHDWKATSNADERLEIENVRLSSRDRIDNWEVKAGYRAEVLYPHPEGGNHGAIDPAAIRNVTGKMRPDGTLTVDLEPGTWRLIRFGHAPTGAKTKHGRTNLIGLEADVMSAEAVKIHFDHYFGPICDTLTAIGCRPQTMCMDSHEAGCANWTNGLERRYGHMHGQDLISWLPALAGYIVGDRIRTEQMMLRFRQTIASAIGEEYYGTFARLAGARGVQFTSQAMLNIANDNIASRQWADRPQGEFWAYQKNGNYDVLDAASAAHLYGKPIASGEAFTDTPYDEPWTELLRIANLAYCKGINEFVICASSYQPWLDRKYDDSNSGHPYVFHRFHPAWKESRWFWDYQARCATLLREGQPVVDLCVYLGEDIPMKTMSYKLPSIPEGFSFDVCTRDALMNRFSAQDGQLAVKGGMKYRALVVQNRTTVSPEANRRIDELAQQGVKVIRCDRGETIAGAGLEPDLAFRSNNQPDDRVTFCHRRTALEDIYFVYNHSAKAYDAPVTLRSQRRRISLWDPLKGTRRKAPKGPFRLRLQPYESVFVIAE